jgi:hypothetical protein
MYCVGQGSGRRSPTTPSIPPLRGTRPVTSGLPQPRACTCVTPTSPASALGEPSINCIDISRAPPPNPHQAWTAALAITDEASPLALRSIRNRLRTAMHRRCQSLVVEACRDGGAGVRAMDYHAGILARDLPETALHATSRSRTTPPSAARLTLGFARGREVTRGTTNHPSINGLQGVRGSNPLSSTRHNATSTPALSALCQRFARKRGPWPLEHSLC